MIVEFQEYLHSWSGSGFQDVNVVKLKPSQYWLVKDFGKFRLLPKSPIYDSRSIGLLFQISFCDICGILFGSFGCSCPRQW